MPMDYSGLYPRMNDESDLFTYMPGTLHRGEVDGVQVLCYSKPNMIAVCLKKFPVVIFVPGVGEERQNYTILCEELASHGYVVLSLDEPYIEIAA